MINKIKHYYHRVSRGYSDKDCWNGDMYLASQIAGVLRWHVEKGIGVPMSFLPSKIEYSDLEFKLAIEARNVEYLHYAEIFEQYAKSGIAYDKDWQEEFGGVIDKDFKNALKWLSKHFTELWD